MSLRTRIRRSPAGRGRALRPGRSGRPRIEPPAPADGGSPCASLEIQAFDPRPGGERHAFRVPAPDVGPGSYALVLDGDCMLPGIANGDLVLCRAGFEAVPGQVAAVTVRGHVPILKRWQPDAKDAAFVNLVPDNGEYSPIRVRRDEVTQAHRVLLVLHFRTLERVAAAEAPGGTPGKERR